MLNNTVPSNIAPGKRELSMYNIQVFINNTTKYEMKLTYSELWGRWIDQPEKLLLPWSYNHFTCEGISPIGRDNKGMVQYAISEAELEIRWDVPESGNPNHEVTIRDPNKIFEVRSQIYDSEIKVRLISYPTPDKF